MPSREWVEYNDDKIRHFTGNWPAVIDHCIKNRFYPTVLFYEKLAEPDEEDEPYEMSKQFNITESHLRDIVSQALELEEIDSGDFTSMLGEEALKEAIELQKKYE